MLITELYAKRGDLILPKWEKLLRWIRENGVIRGPGVRISQGPNGTLVRAESDARTWAHPWQCVPATDGDGKIAARFTVPGTLNVGIVPTIDGAPIDGMQPDGTEGAPPVLVLSPRDSGITYVALRVQVDSGTGEIKKTRGQFNVEVVELLKLDAGNAAGGYPDKSGFGFQPLAAVYWRGNQILRINPVAHHNLQHRFIASTDNRPARHLFWAI